MTYMREVIFGQEPDIQKSNSKARVLAFLVIVLIFVLAWQNGIIASAALVLRTVAMGIWDMLCDVGSACGDFLKYVSMQRQ
jgi:hypothetical protein